MDAIRLALGTLTVIPVRPPRHVDRKVGSWAMTLAPLVGLGLALVLLGALWLLGDAAPLLTAALLIGLLALLTRAMHLDGLADTVDGLGSGRPADEALAIMRKGDVGPFGVVGLVLALLVQVAALAELVASGRGAFAVVLGLVVSRSVLPLTCLRGIPSARPEGLGATVAGSVSPAQAVLAVGLAGASVLAVGLVASGSVVAGVVAASIGLAAGGVVCWRAVRRLGGVTGDVLGACVEVTLTVVLLALTLSPR